jgi:hypothetical protein
MTSRIGAGLLAIGLVGGVGQAIVARPADPTPGLASATTVDVGTTRTNVVVVPNLPGWNLVHVDADVAIGTDPSNLKSPARNGWLPVRLPTGRAELWVSDGRDTGSLVTNTGTGAAAPPGLTGPNGPECANALLGRMLVTGALTTNVECPAETLTPADATELTVTVERLAQNGTTSVAVLTDESPRGRSAAETVRTTATALGMNVVDPGQPAAPLVVVSGAEPSTSRSRTILAPWLRSTLAGSESFQRYVTAQRATYPTLAPSMAGFQAWRSVLESLTAP